MQKICKQCGKQFEITDEDLKFYDKVSPVINGQKYLIPSPTFCPDCRQQRRMAFRNERNLYHRKCDLCGREIISMYSSNKPNVIYCQKCWWSDKYKPEDYGRDFNFNKTLFEQMSEFLASVPTQPLKGSSDMEEYNSIYVNFAGYNKNCFMIFDSDFNEDCYYSNVLKHSRSCVDCSYVQDSELCYDSVDSINSYNLKYSQNCKNCTDSYFLKNCIGCTNCILCSNLSNKQFCIYNQQFNKGEYFKKLESFQLGKKSSINKLFQEFNIHKLKYPQKYCYNVNTENSIGDYLSNVKNCENCFNIGESEDLKYCDSIYKAKDCYDVSSFGEKIEKIYEGGTIGHDAYNILFSHGCVYNSSDLLYCFHANKSQNCFGSISLKFNKYCILNKQYSKEEYENLVPKIIEHLKETGEWGEYFSISMSHFGYNETIANETFSLTKEGVLKMGAKWEQENTPNSFQGSKIEIPDDIKDANQDLIKQILTCSLCGKNYKITAQEYKFYSQTKTPLPDKCFNCRHKERMALRNPKKLWDRNCKKCGKSLKTSYAPERPETVYCEGCYLKEVY